MKKLGLFIAGAIAVITVACSGGGEATSNDNRILHLNQQDATVTQVRDWFNGLLLKYSGESKSFCGTIQSMSNEDAVNAIQAMGQYATAGTTIPGATFVPGQRINTDDASLTVDIFKEECRKHT